MKKTAIAAAFLLVAGLLFGYGTGESGNFEYDGVRQLRVDANTFDVSIQGTRGRRTSLEIRNQPDNYRVLHSVSGDRLEVWVEREFSLLGRPHRGELVFLVPGDAELEVKVSTGDVRISDIRTDRMSVNSSTGDVLVTDVSAALRVETSTGEVEVQDSAGSFTITTSTGEITLVRTSGDVTAASSTGAHRYEDAIGNIDARSTTGEIMLDGVQGALRLRTSTGEQTGRGVSLTGDSSFESSTGNIEMDLTNDVEDLEFNLRSTTGSLEVGREQSQRELYLGGTGFLVRGNSSTGSQEYY
jgi:hypothetical protein